MGDTNDLPIVCTLGPAAVAARRGELLPKLFEQAMAREPLPTGYRLSFAPTNEVLESITQTISTERQCCRFLRFQLAIEPDAGPILLDVTGPDGTREFLDSL